ncbi:hypothetical protein H2200_000818 [Cladophialophora chaetospira]|uniref:Methyltransferase domain-containing protein n=1 Tax=Cladophialophora chaetospira TaxID=386627 RepID=A0AA39CQQ0_9EURO|nr:hypothetical protein H2200_000818 [Cladophialophora chaetospira]
MTALSRRRPVGLRLPLDPVWKSEDDYVHSILTFATTSDLFRNLCGGVHILDFLTREPDLYTTVLPQEWREWFDLVDIDRVLDLLMRDDLERYTDASSRNQDFSQRPPASLVEYIRTIRVHSLRRTFAPVSEDVSDLPRHVSVGMKTKKIHEVTNFSAYVGQLCNDISSRHDHEPLAIVDFGSGKNYLGRTLASPPYNKHVVAIEKRHHNITGARSMDVHAKLAKKEKIMRNKKEWKRQLALKGDGGLPTPPSESAQCETVSDRDEGNAKPDPVMLQDTSMAEANIVAIEAQQGMGSMTYLEHDIQDGDLEDIIYPHSHAHSDKRSMHPSTAQPHQNAMVISLHSCGNLSHHALRSLVSNPSIRAVAVIGCCYNLLTERLGPATYKHPQLRPNHPRLVATGSTYDPHGFPMSKTLEEFSYPNISNPAEVTKGFRLNITARMMAVQAPDNWGPTDSEMFFRRHFYRTLLQKILLDLGVVKQCPDPGMPSQVAGGSITGRDESGTPLIVGTLRKKCFDNFRAYVHGALGKLRDDPKDGETIARLTASLNDEMIAEYESRFAYAKKNLAVIWSLMAFSAGVVESIIVTDRWLFLREQECVEDCWVDIAFDYKQSPRNFVVVGVKKQELQETEETDL